MDDLGISKTSRGRDEEFLDKCARHISEANALCDARLGI